jgi:3D (Asp-Asp-Asp) domain-containing protein
MRFLTLIIGLLFVLVLVFNGLRPAEPVDPYEPVPGAYDGLTDQQITNMEAEQEASRLIDQEVSRGSDRIMVMECTAYTWTGQRTKSGTWPAVGTAAVDPKVIPLGTKLYIEGYGPAVALDTGGAVKGNVIDVYLPTEAECWQWGRRQVEVRILE